MIEQLKKWCETELIVIAQYPHRVVETLPRRNSWDGYFLWAPGTGPCYTSTGLYSYPVKYWNWPRLALTINAPLAN